MAQSNVFYSAADNPEMIDAFEKAQDTFKYFWREVSWEARRIVPGLDLACVKVAFMQYAPGRQEPKVEHMWINDVEFDGEQVSGTLINDPGDITNVKKGDFIRVPLSQISDWLFASQDKTYGGFTIHALRAAMSEEERREHDEAWGLDFGDFNNIEVAARQDENPDNLIEHPMSINMKESFVKFLQEYPAEITNQDEAGYTLLHRETIAGNKSIVEILLQFKADKNVKAANGKSALDFAKQVGWEHIVPLLEN